MTDSDRIFFIIGTGRCGTVWLKTLLDTSELASVYHERYGGEDRAARAISEPKESREYVKRRLPDVERGLKENRYYGEVNSYLLYHIESLREVLGAKIYLLIRDGRDVVRSWYTRGTFDGDEFEKFIKPEGDSRFERLCWFWNESNRLALSKHPSVMIFERLLDDWSYFQHFFGFLEIEEDEWNRQRTEKQNASLAYNLPHHSDWTDEQMAVFRKRCGQLMHELAY